MKATSVRARSSRRVAAAALVVLGAVTLLAGCGFETRQQGAAVVNGEVIHEDQVEETAQQLHEAKFNFPENIVVTALVASPLLQNALNDSGGWQPDATAASAIAAIPDATDTTKEFINTVALLQSFRIRRVVNQARTDADLNVGTAVASAWKKFFGIEMDDLGAIRYDDEAWRAVRKRRPVLIERPDSPAATAIQRIAARILALDGTPDTPSP